ncbi:uncharacterized protein LOC133184500 [Saccostrea echinata]|uniref:uncharacterized protein LOC133184500 n=1 Tax=Saccostrea echinata TaxID=191078 RepID=UPI002A7EF66A|nr:uncharacterized protein LOC133184500 [Saccostrea echinata]
MASTTTMAQDIILCHLCDKRAALLHCNPCQDNLCEECVGRHYMTSSSSSHEIVKYKDMKFQLKFSNCKAHETEKCTVVCQNCDLPVCIKCLTGVHKGHDAVDFSEIIVAAKNRIEENTASVEKILPQFEQADRRIESKIGDLISRCDEMQNLVTEHGKEWRQAIDYIVEKNKGAINKMKEDGIKDLRESQAEIKDTIEVLMQAVRNNRKIIQSVDANEINQYKLTSQNFYQNIPLEVELRLPTFVPSQIHSVQLQKKFGVLNSPVILRQPKTRIESVSKPRKLLDKAIDIKTFSVENNLRQMACLGTDEAWITYKEKSIIQRINTQGFILETVMSSCVDWNGHPSDILIKNGELLYTDRMKRSVNIVRDGKSTNFITVQKGWEPLGLCGTKSGDLLVAMGTSYEGTYKIVRYEGQKVKQEIEKDDRGNSLFNEGDRMFYVAENVNGDICACDVNARAVVVVNKAGKLRYRYKGMQTMEGKFIPCTIITDAMGRILVGDNGNKCIHIIDQDGQFLRSLDDYDRLSIDDLGRLWLGESGGNEVKVFKYTE